ncbi:MAG TPA: TerB family tellurite resistance protein [Candidatus Polarisedimenticolia bacterium]|nr:TerB family tellurite resistance protein [Candidatus Polarisedimenticolia bacterium]
MSIWEHLGLKGPASTPGASESETLRKITRALDAMEPAQARYLACFAFILSRVANADLHISEQETVEMERQVVAWGHLPENQAILAVQIAKSQSRLFGGTENFSVTKLFKELAAPEQRTELLHCLFAVSSADDSVSVVEENEIWKIATELGIPHSDYVAIRAAYRDKREVLRNL